MTTLFNVTEHILESSYIREYWRATAHSQEEILKLHIKQYTPKDNADPLPGDITVIGAHANGFPKELYEPLWDALHIQTKSRGVRIRSIWIADVTQQGKSSVLNEDHLGNDPSWYDHSRDLLHMMNTFRAQMPLPIIGLGHSMGSCQLANLALIHPRLFTTLILLDPVIQPAPTDRDSQALAYSPARSSTFRRDIWPSRKEAIASFRKSPYYQAWDEKVFLTWCKHGLRDIPTALYPASTTIYPNKSSAATEPSVTLTCTKANEVHTFLRPSSNAEETLDFDTSYLATHPGHTIPFYRHEIAEVFDRLPALRPSVFYIFGETSPMSSIKAQNAKMTRTGTGTGGSGGMEKERVKKITLKGIGHLVAMEDPMACAEAAALWLEQEIGRWQVGMDSYLKWTKLSQAEKTGISEEWKTMIGRPPKRETRSKL